MKTTTIRIKETTVKRLKRLELKRNENTWDEAICELLDEKQMGYDLRNNRKRKALSWEGA